MQDNVRRKCIFHPYLTIQCHRHVGHQNSFHHHASLDSYFEEEPVVVGDAPRQHVGPFVSVIYWTYHIKQVLNYEIRQQGKASDHSKFSCECQENVLACIAWQFCWEHYWARSGKNACKRAAKPWGFSTLAHLYYFAHSTKTAMLCRLRMFKNLVHSQDVLTHRMVVCTAHLCHPPPHHHKKDGASLSLLSITIGKKGDWDVNIPARGAVCPKVSCKQNINFDLIFPEAKNLRASGSSNEHPMTPSQGGSSMRTLSKSSFDHCTPVWI